VIGLTNTFTDADGDDADVAPSTAMSELLRMIQAHLDRYGVKRAEFARRAGTKPQTVQNWVDKGTLPRPNHLHGVANVIDAPYLIVLDAALVDAGYRDSMTDDVPALRHRLERLADDDPAAFQEIADHVNVIKAHKRLMPPPAPHLSIAARMEDDPKEDK
jgi:hypothetical protein